MEIDKGMKSLYRIRFHGRGGQGMKTASRILGSAFFLEGFNVQDAPRYGAERRGAPIFAYVRASRYPINERGVIHNPDLVIVADETLLAIPVAGVLHGVAADTVLLVHSNENSESLKARLNVSGPVISFVAARKEEGIHGIRFVGAACVGAASRLTGSIARLSLEMAIRDELSHLGDTIVLDNCNLALRSYDLMGPQEGIVSPGCGISAVGYRSPKWVNIPFEEARVSAPAVFSAGTSERVKTGLWRTERPVLQADLCKRCSLCAIYCPENAIILDQEGLPRIDYEHCKGCLLCVEQCPVGAMKSTPELDGTVEQKRGMRK
ncbi:MAG: 2-oxoacid:acceptor oxidoreductase family protein [Geobacteraceae bacterium]|nr:2-oxoacid:acceptor oxidoreductase family protein [Geobacteraceae bacterium]